MQQSICKNTWILKDSRVCFIFGKTYTHSKSSELAIKGESGIVMWMDEVHYNLYFEGYNEKYI